MNNITYVNKSLFDAPKGSIIIHACNTKGVWGSGIAKEFATRFPNANKVYARECQEKGQDLLGTCLLIKDDEYTIGCLFTSKNYGKLVDPPEQILMATEKAFVDLIRQNPEKLPIHACQINSGLFKVPWFMTESLMKLLPMDFVVYNYSLDKTPKV